jgi:hypothetical protein
LLFACRPRVAAQLASAKTLHATNRIGVGIGAAVDDAC